MVSCAYRRMRVAASACSPALEGKLVRMFAKKLRDVAPWGAGVPSCARWRTHASQISVASAMGIGGVMRARAMGRPGVSRRRWRRGEMSPMYMLEASRKRSACKKASKAAWRSPSFVGNVGSADDLGGLCRCW